MENTKDDQFIIMKTKINSFHYLYGDAEYFYQLSQKEGLSEQFNRTQLSRTAILLYIFSLEALINRAMDHLLPEAAKLFFLEREGKLSIEDKYEAVPTFCGDGSSFDKSKYPFSHFLELIRLRNEFVHPKHDRVAYYKFMKNRECDSISPDELKKLIPGVKEKDLVFRQTNIPKDPYSLLPEHVEKVKKIVDDMVKELDLLTKGKLLEGDWLRTETMELVHPQDANLTDYFKN